MIQCWQEVLTTFVIIQLSKSELDQKLSLAYVIDRKIWMSELFSWFLSDSFRLTKFIAYLK